MHMVTSEVKSKIFQEISTYQIGAVPGHRAQEHLFAIKSFMAMVELKGDAVALQLYDVSKMFDREALLDVLNMK